MIFGRPFARGSAVVAGAALLVLSSTTGAAAATGTIDLGGQELIGAGSVTDRADPAVVTAGLWADTLGGAGSSNDVHYFRYQRQIADSTVHIGVLGAPTAPSDGVGLTVTAGDVDCGSEDTSGSYTTPQALIGAALAIGPDAPGERDSDCLKATSLDIEVDRGFASAETDLPITLKIVEEAPVVSAAEDLPEAAEDDDYTPVAGSGGSSEPGGTALASAPELAPAAGGTTITDTLAEGQTRVWRVPVSWGQQLSAVVDLAAHDDGDEDSTFYGPDVDLRIVTPTRDTIANAAEDGSTTGTYGEEKVRLTTGLAPLRYLNRFASVGAPTVPGDYWVEVSVEPQAEDADGDPVEVPITLTAAVTGERGGEPQHAGEVLGAGDRPRPADYSPQRPYLVGDDIFSATAGDDPVNPDGSAASDDWGARQYGGMGLAVLSLVCLGAGVWRLKVR